MSMLLYDIKKGRKYAIIYIASIFGIAVLILAIIAVWYYKLNPNRDQLGTDGRPKVALSHYVPATYETFGCLGEGPGKCDDFESYVESLTRSPVAFTYTPISEADPGTGNANGTRTITLDSSLSQGDWTAVGKAVTQNNSLAGAQISPDAVSIDGSVVTASVAHKNGDAGSVTAQLTFQFSGSSDDPSDVRVTGVTYGQKAANG